MDFANANYPAVAVAAIAAWVLGAIWYAKPLFGKSWQRELKITEDDIKSANMAKTFGGSLVLMFIMALGMELMFQGHQDELDWMFGLHHGLIIGLFFIATSIGIQYLYQQKSVTLWSIDSLYQTLMLGVMGAILGAWN
jgi:hypothetical protein